MSRGKLIEVMKTAIGAVEGSSHEDGVFDKIAAEAAYDAIESAGLRVLDVGIVRALKRTDLMLEEICKAVDLNLDNTKITMTGNGKELMNISVRYTLDENRAILDAVKGGG